MGRFSRDEREGARNRPQDGGVTGELASRGVGRKSPVSGASVPIALLGCRTKPSGRSISMGWRAAKGNAELFSNISV